jgi:hypothetical protein
MNTSPTPETDAHLEATKTSPGPNLWASADFARKLERERNELSWIPVTERQPTLEDANEYGDVDWSDGKEVWETHYTEPREATHWRRIVLP